MFFLCWIAFVPLLYALLRGRGGEGELLDSEGRSLRPFTLLQGFVVAWTSGVLWYIGTCYWIYPVMHGYGNLGVFAAGLITLGYCLIMGMHHGVFGMLVVHMARRSSLGNRRPLLLAPFFWVALEFFRDRVIGVPWEPLGNSQVDNIPFARLAQFTGVYGLSFAIMLVNCAFTAGFLLFGKRRNNLVLSATAAAVALQVGVFIRLGLPSTTHQAVLVQSNAPILSSWPQDLYMQTMSELGQLSTHAAPPNAPGEAGLIVFPESPVPFFTNDPRFLTWLANIAQDTHSYLIAGSVAYSETRNEQGQPQILNSALVLDPRGVPIGRYDKIHLVPFGEYVPFKSLLFFADKLTREVGDFGRGTERKVFDLDGMKVGIVICYESIFPDEVREFAANGAQVFVNISDDGWYGETGAPFQHLQMARMRAIENQRWILLSTNNGITASIDPMGRVVKKAERNIRTALIAPYNAQSDTTFYTRYGDLFAWACVVISMAGVFLRFRIAGGTLLEARSAP